MTKKVLAVLSIYLWPSLVSAGVIAEAEPLSTGLRNILDFLLSIVGIVGMIGMVMSGLLYFFSGGDMRQAALAKRALFASITGIVIALGGYLFIRSLTSLF